MLISIHLIPPCKNHRFVRFVIPAGSEKLGLFIFAGAISLDGVREGLGRIGVSDERCGRERGGGRGVPCRLCCCCCAWARAFAERFEGVRVALASADEAKPTDKEGSPADISEARDVGKFGNIAEKSWGEICKRLDWGRRLSSFTFEPFKKKRKKGFDLIISEEKTGWTFNFLQLKKIIELRTQI